MLCPAIHILICVALMQINVLHIHGKLGTALVFPCNKPACNLENCENKMKIYVPFFINRILMALKRDKYDTNFQVTHLPKLQHA